MPVEEPPALIAHGRRVFENEAECASCHDGPALTDGESYALGYGLKKKSAFNTPSLRYVAQSAPYLHDGSASSLEQLVEDPHDKMGKTAKLSAEQREALVAYLRTL
jgi:cytochrome c peroxidase